LAKMHDGQFILRIEDTDKVTLIGNDNQLD
jgi:glutamyl/glutaminyl-tRNA synthetase